MSTLFFKALEFLLRQSSELRHFSLFELFLFDPVAPVVGEKPRKEKSGTEHRDDAEYSA